MAILDASNATLLNAVRQGASLAYRDRIPVATDANIAKTVGEIRSYEPFWNEFADGLINRIGLTVLDQNLVYENKLKPLKSGQMQYGGMVQELAVDLIAAQEYDPDSTDVWDAQKPYIYQNFHKINRRNKYKYRMNEDLLAEACVNDGQLSGLLNYTFTSAYTSAENDEYQCMLQLLSHYQRNEDKGFANLHVENVATAADPKAAGLALTRIIREAYLFNKGFLRVEYNPCGVPCAAPDLVLLVTPKVLSYLDVYSLAFAFNMEKAEFLADAVITIDQWPEGMEGTQALLLDRNFYRVYDSKRRNVSIFNPDTLDWVYTYHIWQVLSVSRMKTALRFSTDADNVTLGEVTAPATPTGVEITVLDEETEFNPGDNIAPDVVVTYDNGDTDGDAYCIITGVASDTDGDQPVIPSTGTYIDRMGTLHIAEDCPFTSLTITAVATLKPTVTGSVTITRKSTDADASEVTEDDAAAQAEEATGSKADAMKAIVS